MVRSAPRECQVQVRLFFDYFSTISALPPHAEGRARGDRVPRSRRQEALQAEGRRAPAQSPQADCDLGVGGEIARGRGSPQQAERQLEVPRPWPQQMHVGKGTPFLDQSHRALRSHGACEDPPLGRDPYEAKGNRRRDSHGLLALRKVFPPDARGVVRREDREVGVQEQVDVRNDHLVFVGQREIRTSSSSSSATWLNARGSNPGASALSWAITWKTTPRFSLRKPRRSPSFTTVFSVACSRSSATLTNIATSGSSVKVVRMTTS